MAPAIFSSPLTLVAVCLALFSSCEARLNRRASSKSLYSTRTILNKYHVPRSNGTALLPRPLDDTRIKAITLGRGTQNYTCATNTASSVPAAIGAVATLFDATPLLAFLPVEEGRELLNVLPGFLVQFPYAALENSTLPVMGHHYFNAAGVPTFDLTSSGVGLLLAGKVGAILPPKNSVAGPDRTGNGAVDWLALTAKPGSSDLQEVYRTWTAGGKPPANCADQAPVIQMQYAAQYWLLG